MFITTCTRPDRVREVRSYLYEGQTIVGLPTETRYGTFQIVDTGTDERYRSEYLRDRLSSGLFGANLFDTLEEAEAYIETWKE